MRKVGLLLLVVLTLTACGARGESRPSGEQPVSGDLEGAWELVTGKGRDGDFAALDLNRITLSVKDDLGGGRSGCNWYGTGMWVEGKGFDFEDASMTAMGCGAAIEAVEEAYSDALLDVEHSARTDDRLVLTGPKSELTFRLLAPISTEGLFDRTWILTEVIDDGVSKPALGEPTTVRIASDGSIELSHPCGSETGRYTESGDELDIVEWHRGPDRSCKPGLFQQGQLVSSAFGGAFRPAVDGDRLEIGSATSRVRAIYRAE